jgi:hypothetical protein
LTLLFRHDDETVSTDLAMLQMVERALAVIGTEPEGNHLRLLLVSNRAALLASLGRHNHADRAFREAVELAERGGAPPLRLATINVQAASTRRNVTACLRSQSIGRSAGWRRARVTA